uniref:Ubiquitin-like protease family profile domain-containing protein n=1 Tax=Lactuca sativa TaxID=4236 RepID=A0A9R1W173_LACSA|nr:hypothetical protein LSAT_V11C400186960 [Lactuca sativa]
MVGAILGAHFSPLNSILGHTMDQPQRKKRSVTLIRGNPRNKVDLEIEFDELGQNIGATQSQFSNYCGVMVRTRISILILRWDEVPKAEVDELWLNIKKHWNIEDDSHKKQVLKICNQAWKAYKSRLVTEYLKKGRNPVPEYPYLDEPTWNAFVQLKTSPSFQEISSKATETARLNKYPPRIGPRGYRGMKPQWEKEMESGNSTEFHNIRSERARNFILARLKRDPTGMYSLPTNLYPLASDLIEKDTQLSHGDWFPGPGEDVLTEVLGPEHPGRTRAVGHNVGLRQSMPRVDKKKRKSHDKNTFEDMKEKMRIEVEAMMEAKMEAKIEEMNAQIEEMKTYMHRFLSKNEGRHITSPVLKKNSVVSTVSDELDGIKTPTACELMIPYGAMNQKCAKGMVFPYGNGQIHSVPLNANHLKVSIDKIYDQYDCIPLPVSTEEASKLYDVLHGIVQWPRNAIKIIQIKLNVEQDKRCSSLPVATDPQPRITKSVPAISKGVVKKTKPAKESLIPHTSNNQVELEKMPLVMRRMYKRLMNREAPGDAIYVEAEPGILGAQKIETYIYPEEILRLLNKQWLDISVITWFQIMLHSMLETHGGNKVNKCAFISPSEIQATICESNGEGVVSYIVDAMRVHEDKEFFVAPYWQGLHWTLLVICPNKGTGYILDSLKNSNEKAVENYIVVKYVEEAVASLKEDIETTHPMNWTLVECNQQPSGWECGFYVMRWMFEFVLTRQYEFPNKSNWNDKNPFPDWVLNEIIVMWSSRFESMWLKLWSFTSTRCIYLSFYIFNFC